MAAKQIFTVGAAAGKWLFSSASTIERFLCPLSRAAGAFSACLSLVMAAAILLDAVADHLLGIALPFIIEAMTFLLVITAFLSIAETHRNGKHVTIDLFTRYLPLPINLFNQTIFSILGIFLFISMSWQLFQRGLQEYLEGSKTLISHLPFFPLSFIATFGCLLLSLVLGKELLENIGKSLLAYKRPVLVLILILVISVAIIMFPAAYRAGEMALSKTSLGAFMLVFSLLLMFLGFPVAFSMAFIGLMGTWMLNGQDIAFGFMRMTAIDSVAEYYLCVIPLFILMGFLCFNAGISKALFRSAYRWVGRVPGGLAISTVIGCSGFAAICGDSMANAATMGSVALPEMKKYKYDDSLATGAVAAGGTLGILIPPSIGFIAYGIVTQESIGKLFIAGIIPGIILALLFCATIFVRCQLNPKLGPPAAACSWRQKFISLKGTWQVAALFLMVMGGLYSGLTTPTQAGGLGVIGALLLAAFSSEFTLKKLYASLLDGVQMSVMIITMLIGVWLLNNFIILTELPVTISNFLQSLKLSPNFFFVGVFIFYLIMGMFVNIIPMVVVTLPVIFPSILAMGFDPIWFGVVMVIIMEMGQISPPFGINVFVIAGVAKDVPMEKIFKGIVPFILCEVVMIILLVFFPKIALFLPNLMETLPSIAR